MTVLEEVGTHIQENATLTGMTGSVGKDIFLTKMPATPDNCVGVIDTGGVASSLYAPTKNLTFQVVVRNKSYETAITIANSIRDLFHLNEETNRSHYELTSGGTLVFRSVALQEPYNLGQDEGGRYEITCNYQFLIA